MWVGLPPAQAKLELAYVAPVKIPKVCGNGLGVGVGGGVLLGVGDGIKANHSLKQLAT